MITNNNRRHKRLACEIPVQIEAENANFRAMLIEASRSGVRLRVPGQPLGLYRLAPMALVGRQVARLLGVEFEVRIHPDLLGPLLGKRLRPIRIGQRDPGSADVELGCVLSEAFSDVEASMVGLTLPTLLADGSEGSGVLEAPSPRQRTDLAVARPPAREVLVVPDRVPPPAVPARTPAPLAAAPHTPAPASHLRLSVPPVTRPSAPMAKVAPASPAGSAYTPPKPGPSQGVAPVTAPGGPELPAADTRAPDTGSSTATARSSADPTKASLRGGSWNAHVNPAGDRRLKPFIARAERVGAAGVELRVAERALLQIGGTPDVAGTTEALGTAYGAEVALRIMDGHTHIWTGPARIEMVEVGSTAPYPVTLWVAYGRPLRAAEQRALNLA